jgi:pSer/pThr/pTyr-binding forkhead associated (FHA) protein
MKQVAGATRPARMKILQLTTIVRDLQTATMTAQSFTRAPVLVGRQCGNQLRLDARTVSRRHGAFLFSKDGLQYIDYASANGSYVDGVRVAPNRPVDIRTSSVITMVPFQIVAQLNLVDAGRLLSDPNASTPVETIGGGSRAERSAQPRDSIEVAQRATRVLGVVAEQLLAAGSRTAQTLSPLRLAASSAEIVALLLDPAAGDQRLDELRELLGELLRPRLTAVP